MTKSNKNIPLNSMAENFSRGISIDKISIEKSAIKTVQQYKETTQSHRDEGHTFHIVVKGNLEIEIDFKIYQIKSPSIVYMHPNQVHRIIDFTDITVCSLSITNENLHIESLKFLEQLTPTAPLFLTTENYKTTHQLFLLSHNFSNQSKSKIFYPLLKDSCNTLITFLISQFLTNTKSESNFSRFEVIAKSFKQLLENNYTNQFRPNEYAKLLNISTAYLNECIKNSTGYSVSQHIQDRIILEAKRMLYHTDKSAKEIAFDLGYVDYPYFSKLFTKSVGMSALTFRNKNRD